MKRLQLEYARLESSGYGDDTTLTIFGQRRKRGSNDFEDIEIKIVNLRYQELLCARKTLRDRLVKIRDFFATEWNRIKADVGE